VHGGTLVLQAAGSADKRPQIAAASSSSGLICCSVKVQRKTPALACKYVGFKIWSMFALLVQARTLVRIPLTPTSLFSQEINRGLLRQRYHSRSVWSGTKSYKSAEQPSGGRG